MNLNSANTLNKELTGLGGSKFIIDGKEQLVAKLDETDLILSDLILIEI